ncbi:SURF1 family protein [Rugamonas sp. CCM 8940]|uniref:SURF1 family protein n=1 Tax=Rugamonas sp. CCM 8940 TaxID=2765359 RepID=UPI0018F30CDC|nr:SURF1 family cytochrome oxidase biogenesis protein [Rugamonas sp. CCM 8940]MBJ7311984.1 SURF1 family protein [Rugamonas sp. CCM 8940]
MTKQPHVAEGGASVAPRSGALRLALLVGAVLLIAAFLALGGWQVQRLFWKRALIERVEQRVHAAPGPAPGAARWDGVSTATDEYRHVSVTGILLFEASVRSQAVTALGSGHWLLTPLCRDDGTVVLVNRGFVEAAAPAAAAATGAAGAAADSAGMSAAAPAAAAGCQPASSPRVTMTGLLRISEPGGGFLRKNDPSKQRWYSRDVRAIGAARGLRPMAPYFIDADPGQEPVNPADGQRPVGGLTVIAFPNSHLVYALTWFALASMAAAMLWWLLRGGGQERGAQRRRD